MNRLFEYRCTLLIAAGAAWAACGVPGTARAAPLSPVEFTALAARCAPSVPQGTLGAVARTESSLNPWALHDNTTGVTEQPANQQAPLSDARAWIGRGDSVDVGLMQINSANFGALGLTARSALDPCTSLAGGAAVLRAAYAGGKTTADQEVALLMALSRYNTGSPLRGIMNGYAHSVMMNAGGLPVPALQSQAVDIQVLTDPNAPPSWDISATGTYAEAHGAPWIVSVPSSLGIKKKPEGPPVPTAAAETVAANVVGPSSTQPTTRSP
jgi:type IV secretion system protein VirB1